MAANNTYTEDVYPTDETKETRAFKVAAKSRDWKGMEKAIADGFDINTENENGPYGKTFLSEVISGNDKEATQWALDHGARPTIEDEARMNLEDAVCTRNTPLIEWCLANLGTTMPKKLAKEHGKQMLDEATWTQNWSLVDLYQDHGVEPTIRQTIRILYCRYSPV